MYVFEKRGLLFDEGRGQSLSGVVTIVEPYKELNRVIFSKSAV
jgi:hypothetical protein